MTTDGVKARLVVLGTPGFAALKRVLMEGMLCPKQGPPSRPESIHVAHRWALLAEAWQLVWWRNSLVPHADHR
jgi:hypothetical protein